MKDVRIGQVIVEVEYLDRPAPVESVQRPEFPELLSRWAEGGPRFRTEIWVNRDGEETRAILASRPMWEWTVPIGEQEPVDAEDLMTLFRAVGGQVTAFSFRNPISYQMALEPIGWGDGSTRTFQAKRTYRAGGRTIEINITNLERGSVAVYLCDQANGATPLAAEGIDYVVDYDLGRVTFLTAPEDECSILLTANFWIPARFSREDVMADIETSDVYAVGSIEVQEVRS